MGSKLLQKASVLEAMAERSKRTGIIKISGSPLEAEKTQADVIRMRFQDGATLQQRQHTGQWCRAVPPDMDKQHRTSSVEIARRGGLKSFRAYRLTGEGGDKKIGALSREGWPLWAEKEK